MFRSIKARLTVTICCILLLVFILQMAVYFIFADEFYVLQKMNILKDAYSTFSHALQEADSTATMEEIIQKLDVDRNLEFFIADQDMNLIYSNSRFMNMEPGPANPYDQLNPADPAISGDTPVPVKPSDEVKPSDPRVMMPYEFDFERYPASLYKESDPTLLKTDMMDMNRIRLLGKIDKGDTTYYIAIRLSVQSLSRETKNTNLFILYITAFGIIAGGVTVYFISKRFTKPIEEINRVAIRVSNLDFTSRAKISARKDEIGSLASNINLMSDRLERNILDLKEANRKLEIDNEFMNRVDEQRKELIANISHELKTPLAILSGYSEMLKTEVPGIDKAFYYDTIQDETRKMNILIQNLLDLSNMENKLTELSLDEIDPVDFVNRIIKKYSIIFQKNGIRFEFEEATCGNILADTLYLEEAISNYLSNAVSHTKKGKLIRIRVGQKDDEAVISVFNEGDHIDEAQLDKIWNSFYRVDKSRTRTSQNNIGLGLYIVRSVMNAHHGKCGVTNRENGVEFWLSLKVIR